MTTNNHHKYPCQPITQFQIGVSATNVEKMTLVATPDLSHLMVGTTSLVRWPLQVIIPGESIKEIMWMFYFMILVWIHFHFGQEMQGLSQKLTPCITKNQ
jgi:hypothetical protein